MNDLQERIRNSEFRTQERFAHKAGINEAIMSKYCREMKELKGKHLQIVEKMLNEKKTK
jgi:hypothetical protein